MVSLNVNGYGEIKEHCADIVLTPFVNDVNNNSDQSIISTGRWRGGATGGR